MEMKGYQKAVIRDLTHYLELLNETQNYIAAFRQFWREKERPGVRDIPRCDPRCAEPVAKVPTGGGKTFIACNAVRPIF